MAISAIYNVNQPKKLLNVSKRYNVNQPKKLLNVSKRSALKLKVQDIVAIINSNASSKELKEIFGSVAKITKQNLVDFVAEQGKYYKLNKVALDPIVAIINNGIDYKKKAILGANEITVETLVSIVRGSRSQVIDPRFLSGKHSVGSMGSAKAPDSYNANGQIQNQGIQNALQIDIPDDDDIFYDCKSFDDADNVSDYESFNGDDGEVFYEALDNIDDSSNVVDSGVFGKITSAIKGLKAFFGY